MLQPARLDGAFSGLAVEEFLAHVMCTLWVCLPLLVRPQHGTAWACRMTSFGHALCHMLWACPPLQVSPQYPNRMGASSPDRRRQEMAVPKGPLA
jgi:hypothetical protein